MGEFVITIDWLIFVGKLLRKNSWPSGRHLVSVYLNIISAFFSVLAQSYIWLKVCFCGEKKLIWIGLVKFLLNHKSIWKNLIRFDLIKDLEFGFNEKDWPCDFWIRLNFFKIILGFSAELCFIFKETILLILSHAFCSF